jgi:nucleoside-diphosphate-sugar epimerase
VVVTEATPTADVDDNNPRIARLIRAEQAVLSAGGCCLRLAGLYNLDRGAHNFWLTTGSVAASPDGLINLLHYDDAAAACVAALRAGLRSQIFLVSDGHPMTRQEICAASLQAKLYAGYTMPEFSAPPSNPATRTGKIYRATITNERLQWAPQYASFDSFMKSHS